VWGHPHSHFTAISPPLTDQASSAVTGSESSMTTPRSGLLSSLFTRIDPGWCSTRRISHAPQMSHECVVEYSLSAGAS